MVDPSENEKEGDPGNERYCISCFRLTPFGLFLGEEDDRGWGTSTSCSSGPVPGPYPFPCNLRLAVGVQCGVRDGGRVPGRVTRSRTYGSIQSLTTE